MKLINLLLPASLIYIFNYVALSQDKEYCGIQIVIPKDCPCSIQEIKEKGEFNLLIEDTSYLASIGEQNPMIETGLQMKFNQSGIYIDSIAYPFTLMLYSLVYQLFDKQEIISTFSFYPLPLNNTIYLQCSFFNRNSALFMSDLENDKFISFTTNITSKINSGTSYQGMSLNGCEIIQLKKEKRKIYAYYNKSYELKNDSIRTSSFCDCNYDSNSGFLKSVKLNRKQIKKLKQHQKLIIEQYPNNLKGIVQRNITYNKIDNKNVYFDVDQNNFELLENIFWADNN